MKKDEKAYETSFKKAYHYGHGERRVITHQQRLRDDYDLNSAYPSAMTALQDIDWKNDWKNEG